MLDDLEACGDIKELCIGNYILVDTLGQGSYGAVMSARHIPTGAEVAVKVLLHENNDSREVDTLKMLSHPNIITLYEVVTTKYSTYIVMEYVTGGDLHEYIMHNNRMTEAEARPMFRQLTSALHYCHQWGIVHRDLKPQNILLDEARNIKLADFGLSAEYSDENLTSFCGTLDYMAPEAVTCKPYYGPTVDVWSLGVILYRMVTKKLPFLGSTDMEVKASIVSGDYLEPSYISQECRNILKKLMTVDPSQRSTLQEVMKDPWVNTDEQELGSYIGPPWGDLDPQVTEKMTSLGFDPQEIQDSVIERKFDEIMGTYMILATTKNKMKGRKIRVRPYRDADPECSATSSPDILSSAQNNRKPASYPVHLLEKMLELRCSATSSQEVLPPGQSEEDLASSSEILEGSKTTLTDKGSTTLSPEVLSSGHNDIQPACDPASPEAKLPTLPPSEEAKNNTPSASPEAGSTTPALGPESTTATPRPALQHGPGYAHTTHSSGYPTRSGGAEEGAPHGVCLQAGHLDDEVPASSSGHRVGWHGLARRVIDFFLKCTCVRPCTKKFWKRNKVKPG